LTIDTKSGDQEENFYLSYFANEEGYELSFRNCVKESVEKCDAIMKDTIALNREIGAPQIQGLRMSSS